MRFSVVVMRWFSKKGGVKKIWEYRTKGILWKIVPTSDFNFVGEDRDVENKIVSFFFVDANAGKARWEISFDEKWWIGIEAVHEGYVLFHEYATPELPEHKKIHVVDSLTGRILWSNSELKFLFADMNNVYAEQVEHFINKIFDIDIRSGEIIREVDENSIEQKRRTYQQTTSDYLSYPVSMNSIEPQSSEANECLEYIRKKGVEPIYTEYIFRNLYVVMVYYSKELNKKNLNDYCQKIICYDTRNKKALYHDILHTKISTPLPDTFMMIEDKIYFIKDKRSIVALEIQI